MYKRTIKYIITGIFIMNVTCITAALAGGWAENPPKILPPAVIPTPEEDCVHIIDTAALPVVSAVPGIRKAVCATAHIELVGSPGCKDLSVRVVQLDPVACPSPVPATPSPKPEDWPKIPMGYYDEGGKK